MIAEYKAFIEAFQMGKKIASAAKLKQWQFVGNSLGTFLVSCATISQAFGYHIPLSEDTLKEVGVSAVNLYLFFNAILVVVTNSQVGKDRRDSNSEAVPFDQERRKKDV